MESGISQKAESIPQEAQGSSINSANNTYGDFELIGDGGTVSFEDSVLTIDGGIYTISMAEGVTSTSQRLELSGGVTLTLNGIQIDSLAYDEPESAMTITGDEDVNVLLADGSNNVLKGAAGSEYGPISGNSGIETNSEAWLIIGTPEDSEGTGSLETIGGFSAPGIGSRVGDGKNIKITSGTVTAKGGIHAAGIGGGGE